MSLIPQSVRQDVIALTILAGFVTWFCYEMIFSAQIPFFRDLLTYFYPIKFSVAEAFKASALPLWDHRMAAGFPVMAGLQSAVFYPPSIAHHTLTFFSAIRFTFVFHYALAAAGAYVLFRSWKSPIYVSLIGAVCFAFAGTIVSLSNLLNHFQSAVWLPWLLYSWEKVLRVSDLRQVCIFSLVALCQVLAGSPEIFLLSTVLLAIDTLRFVHEENLSGLGRVSARAFAAGCMILGLGMVQWLPTAELVTQSRRDQAIHISEALSWSLHPTSLIGLFLPTLEPDVSLTIGIRLLAAQGVPFLLSHYIGVFGLFGFCSWSYAAPPKERAVVLAAIAGSLVLALGSFTPVYPFLYERLPPLRVLRFPEKYWYVTFSLLVFVVVRGLHRMDEQQNSRAWWKIAALICAGWLIPYLVFCIRPQLLASFLVSSGATTSVLTDPKTIAAILVAFEKQIALSLSLAGALALYRLGYLRHGLLGALLVLAAFFDLSSVTKPLHFLRDQNVVAHVPRILDNPPADHGRLFYYPPGNNVHPSFMKVAGNPSYHKATEISLNNLLPNAGILYGFEYFQDIDALGRRSYTDFLMFINSLPDQNRGKLLRILNVKYVVAFHAVELAELSLVRQFPEHYSVLYEVDRPVPRAYIAQRALFDVDAKRTLERMASEDFDPSRDVVLDAPVALQSKELFYGRATIRAYENRRVLIEAHLNEPGILVLTDAFYPGWKVFVDGREQMIRRANYLFRGVELPSGAHKVEFIYDPLSFKAGLAISLLTVSFLIAITIAGAARGNWLNRVN